MTSDGAAARLRIEPRWTDFDPVGHVNNSVFLVYAEEARARFLHATLPDASSSIVVVHNSIDYHSSVLVTDVLDVASAVESVGNSSFVTVNEIDNTDGRHCATVRTVQVVLGPDGKSRSWTTSEREKLIALVDRGEPAQSHD